MTPLMCQYIWYDPCPMTPTAVSSYMLLWLRTKVSNRRKPLNHSTYLWPSCNTTGFVAVRALGGILINNTSLLLVGQRRDMFDTLEPRLGLLPVDIWRVGLVDFVNL